MARAAAVKVRAEKVRTEKSKRQPAAVAELAGGLRLSVTRLARILRQQDTGDLTASMVSALATVNRAGRITLGALAAREHVAAPSVTRVVDKLQRAGLVERTASEQDGRVSFVAVTADGQELIEESRTRRTAWLAARLEQLSESDLDALMRAAPILERIVAEAAEAAATDDPAVRP
jgi:DNA-binding MarR family transcriptional regulator